MQQLIPPMGGSIADADNRYVNAQTNSPDATLDHGFYPINDLGFWHGGVHFEGNDPVRAIADGELIAYRINDLAREGKLNDKDVKYSNGFVLLKHQFLTPKQEPIEFFSLYMHLLPAKELKGDQIDPLPPAFLEYVYTVATDEDGMGLAIFDDEGVKIAVTPLHAYLEVLNEHPDQPWMHNKPHARVQFDGLFEGYAQLQGHAKKIQGHTWQVQSKNDAPLNPSTDRGLNVRASDSGDAQVQYIAPKNSRLLFKNTKSQTNPKALADGKRHELASGGFIYKTDKSIHCKRMIDPEVVFNDLTVCSPPIAIKQGQILGYPGKYLDRGPLIHFEIFAADRKFTDCLSNCKTQATEPPAFLKNAKAETLGRKILKLKERATLYEKKIKKEKQPHGKTVERTVFDTPKGQIAPGRYAYEVGVPHVTEDGTTYREVVYNLSNKKSGWIAENDPFVEAVYSPYDWNAIWETLQDQDFADDGFCDAEKLFKEIDKDGDKRIDAKEIKAAVSDPKINHWLKHLICIHPTEWDAGQNGSKWQRLKEAPWNFKDKLASRYDQAIAHIEDMQWWGKVKAKCATLPDPNRVYHFHPVGFMEHFNMLAVPFTMNDAWHIIDVVAKAESGGETNPYAAINDDREFRGKDKKGIDMPYTGIVHIGLSYGIIQFTQDGGSLGVLLTAMYHANASKFEEIFGDNFEELLSVTNAKGANGVELWCAAPFNKKSRKQYEDEREIVPEVRGARVKRIRTFKPSTNGPNPIEQDLWEGVWLERFMKAATVEEFKQVQRRLAFDKYFRHALKISYHFGLRSAKGIAVAFDRCVQQGHGAPSAEGKVGNGAWRTFEKAAIALYGGVASHWMQDEKLFLDSVRNCTSEAGSARKRVGEILQGKFSKELPMDGYEVSSYLECIRA
ncbi:MAG: hypothetical protein AABY83_14545 [Pseudomonadota bacterium]